jgi:VWFA-related protein
MGVALGAALAMTAGAQPLFRSAVDLVMVAATVTAPDALRQVRELGSADFRIYEDGVLQELSVVSHEPRALSICIVVDSSPSMASGRQPMVSRAVDTLLDRLAANDEASLHFFSTRFSTQFEWTPAPHIKPVSWLQWRLSLGTALIDALREALTRIDTARNPLPVILVITDGGENASGLSLSGLAATRRQSETLVYGIQTDLPASQYAPLVNRAFTNFLPQVVGDSGGMIQRVRSPEEAETAALALLAELRSQYTLGYVPKRAPDGRYRTIRVDVVDSNLTIRHRAGYLATPHPN